MAWRPSIPGPHDATLTWAGAHRPWPVSCSRWHGATSGARRRRRPRGAPSPPRAPGRVQSRPRPGGEREEGRGGGTVMPCRLLLGTLVCVSRPSCAPGIIERGPACVPLRVRPCGCRLICRRHGRPCVCVSLSHCPRRTNKTAAIRIALALLVRASVINNHFPPLPPVIEPGRARPARRRARRGRFMASAGNGPAAGAADDRVQSTHHAPSLPSRAFLCQFFLSSPPPSSHPVHASVDEPGPCPCDPVGHPHRGRHFFFFFPTPV